MWKPKNNLGLILGLVFGILALLVILVLLFWLWRSGRLHKCRYCSCCTGSGKRPDFRRNNFSVARGGQDLRSTAEFREVQSPPRKNPSPVSLAGARASHQRSRSVGASTRVPSVFWDDYGSRADPGTPSRRVVGGEHEVGSTKVIL